MSQRVCVGVVIGAHGIRGAVRIKSFTEDPAAIAAYGPVEDEAGQRRFRLTLLGTIKGGVTARLDGVADRNTAEALKGVRLMVPRSALPEPEDEDAFYVRDLVGLTAEKPDGSLLGRVTAVFDFGAGDIVEIAGTDGSILVPFTRAAVPLVDIGAGRLVVDPPDETRAEVDEGEGDGR